MTKKFKILLSLLLVGIILLLFINLNTGYLNLKFQDFTDYDTVNSQVAIIRLYRVAGMILAGLAIPTSGFLLQEYFQNPLAGPSVLGITSVASLGAAVYIFFSQQITLPEILQNSFISISAIGASIILLLFLISFSGRFQDKSFLIIFGFLISALTGAVISVLQFYAEDQNLKNYILWSFGANNQISGPQIIILSMLVFFGLYLTLKTIKPLIGSALGTAYAMSLGVNLRNLKLLVIASSSVLSASVTAFLGPILFIGIVIPHFSRMLYNPSQLWHQWILNMLLGLFAMQLFSIISEISQFPLNIITSLFGIPVILLMMIRGKSFN